MFKKLVANLPYNPSLINQIGFYADRLRQEKSIRRLSFIFMAMAMVIQSVAVISPPEKSYANSSTHLMNGLNTKSDILAYYDNPASETKDIFTHYNLTRQDIANLSNTPDVSIFTNDGNDWWTVGLYSLSQRSDVKQEYKNNERAIQYEPGNFVYERQWRAFDIKNANGQWRPAWRGTSSATGQTFWIVQSCGNITWIDTWDTPEPEPEPDPDPELDIRKSINKQGPLNPGDTFKYQIEYRNKKAGSQAAVNVEITDKIDTRYVDAIPSDTYTVNSAGYLTFNVGNLPYRPGNAYRLLEVPVRLKNPLPRELEVCNEGASITATNASRKNSNRACIDIITPCPYDSSIPNINNENCTIPVVQCSLLDAAVNLEEKEVTFRTEVSASNRALVDIKSYAYDFGNGASATFESSEFTHEVKREYGAGRYEASVVVSYSAPSEDGVTDQQKSCSREVRFEEELSQQKEVKNLTQELEGEEALNSKVRGGDELEYTLITTNTNNYDVVVDVEDYIGDILDYAELDLDALAEAGGTFDEESNKVVWEDVTVPARDQVKSVFKVKMISPVPATNRPSDQGGDYDCEITNEYGDRLSLAVACPAVKGIETLPNTGPGTSMAITTGITFVVGYFFARSRLMSKELDLIRNDYSTTGGV